MTILSVVSRLWDQEVSLLTSRNIIWTRENISIVNHVPPLMLYTTPACNYRLISSLLPNKHCLKTTPWINYHYEPVCENITPGPISSPSMIGAISPVKVEQVP